MRSAGTSTTPARIASYGWRAFSGLPADADLARRRRALAGQARRRARPGPVPRARRCRASRPGGARTRRPRTRRRPSPRDLERGAASRRPRPWRRRRRASRPLDGRGRRRATSAPSMCSTMLLLAALLRHDRRRRRRRRAGPSPGRTIADHLGQAVGDEEHRAALARASARMTAKTRSARSDGSAAVISSSTSSCGLAGEGPGQVEHPQHRQRHVAAPARRSRRARSIACSRADRPQSVPVRRRFWAIVRSGTSAGSWKTGASPSRAACAGEPIRTSLPVDRDRARGRRRSRPVSIFTSVLLPAPFAPSSACTSPGSTTRSAERSATTAP